MPDAFIIHYTAQLLPLVKILYPTGQNYSLELMFAKIAKNLHPQKLVSTSFHMPENNIEDDKHLQMVAPTGF